MGGWGQIQNKGEKCAIFKIKLMKIFQHLDFFQRLILVHGLPRWLSDKASFANAGDNGRRGFDPWVGEDPLKEEMATHSSILNWAIPRTEEPGGLQSIGSRVAMSQDTNEEGVPRKISVGTTMHALVDRFLFQDKRPVLIPTRGLKSRGDGTQGGCV